MGPGEHAKCEAQLGTRPGGIGHCDPMFRHYKKHKKCTKGCESKGVSEVVRWCSLSSTETLPSQFLSYSIVITLKATTTVVFKGV